jgi:hypothetical protein
MSEQQPTEEHDVEVEPNPEPEPEPSDPHEGPLDDDEDGRFLRRDDPRRRDAEERRGREFPNGGE